jgi:flagellar motor switch/type III secretory pathway protein FliN
MNTFKNVEINVDLILGEKEFSIKDINKFKKGTVIDLGINNKKLIYTKIYNKIHSYGFIDIINDKMVYKIKGFKNEF